MRRTLLWTVTPVAVVSATLLAPAPAQATVHEIVAQWCSGQDELEPPGISGGSNADNFAQPLNANGFVNPTPFDPDGPDGPMEPGLLLFDFGHPASKTRPTGVYIPIDQTPAGPLYLPLVEPDPAFPAFQHCPRLAG